MVGIIKKVNQQGSGIIDGADGSKVPFILSDVMSPRVLKPGQKVAFSVRRVKGKAFAQNVTGMGDLAEERKLKDV
jgi:hypothetical protein